MITPKFNSVVYVEDMGNTPASINWKTSDLYLNKNVFTKLENDYKLFVLFHEYGHYYLKTKNEFKADKFAFQQLVQLGFPLKKMILALSSVLSGKSRQHTQRVFAMYQLVKEFKNKNKK